ncbi:MAG TPA: hypothetical protein DIW77_12750 [Chromatiaceae bacterium]|jgi:hypothetical protein|nr:hypothetical protein [Chromatiaceae bacterium]
MFRRIGEERPKPVRGNIVVYVVQRIVRQAHALKLPLHRSATINKELCERAHDSDTMQRYSIYAMALFMAHRLLPQNGALIGSVSNS